MDINEIRKRAQQASEKAADAMKKTFEKSEKLVNNIEISSSEKEASISAAEAEEQNNANTQRQIEILGQIFGAEGMAQMAVNEELLQEMVNEKSRRGCRFYYRELDGADVWRRYGRSRGGSGNAGDGGC